MIIICEKCDREFKSNRNLYLHLNKKIPCDRIIKCNDCLKEFKTKQHLNNHINRKNKCQKLDLEEENKELKRRLEIAESRQPKIINNNNIQNITNNTINIFTPEGKLHHTYFLKSNPLEQLEMEKVETLSNLSLEEYTDELSNIYNFTNMVKEVCFNMMIPENWIICNDDLFNQLQLKIDKDNIVNCIDNLLYLIYKIAKQVVNYKELDRKLILFYKIFIGKYENDEYKDNENVKKFIKLCNEELFKHFSKILKIINERKNNTKKIEEVKINEFGKEDIEFIKKNTLNIELNNIIDKKYLSDFYKNKFKINDFNYTGIIDLKMIDIFTYFLELIYNTQENNKTIKYDNNQFFIYSEDQWKEIEIKELIINIFSKIWLILKIYKINLTENDHMEDYIEDTYKEKITYGYQIGENKYYKKILIQYFINSKSFDNHIENIVK